MLYPQIPLFQNDKLDQHMYLGYLPPGEDIRCSFLLRDWITSLPGAYVQMSLQRRST